MSVKKKLEEYPVLPLRDIVVFPHMVVPLFVGRKKSVQALDYVMKGENKYVLLVTQKNMAQDFPDPEELFTVGTLSSVLQMLKLPDGTVKILIEGTKRSRIVAFEQKSDFLIGKVDNFDEVTEKNGELEGLCRSVIAQFEHYIKLNQKIPAEVLVSIHQIEDPSKLADTISSYFSLKLQEKQELLEIANVNERLEKILVFIGNENSVLQIEQNIRKRVKKQMEKTQKEYYLNEQLKAIYKELGDTEEGRDELSEWEDKVKKVKLSKEAKKKALSEIRKLRFMNHSSAEATVIRNYLDWLLSIPWKKRSVLRRDLKEAEVVLEKDHYGIKKVKERIIEHLAVQMRVNKMRGPILCFVGPPGVGKTSLGRAIAEAMGRQFVRISLGGVRDESEIRGHRRTYIGAMPGKIIQGMKKAKTSNPLFLLDEVDKLGNDWRGDPSSALLEVLDPEQNVAFNDHYLEVDYDLSDVVFLTTANTLNMPQPLLDRLEVIRIPGYTDHEKFEISKKHLISKQVKLHGIKKDEISIDDDAIYKIIHNYTREAGVRNLEREIAGLSRKAIKEILVTNKKTIYITKEKIKEYLGVEKYQRDRAELENAIGIVTGMAWTEFGGELLLIEVLLSLGTGQAKFTGKLGDVMKESIQAALSYVKAHSKKFNLEPTLFDKRDCHIHVPEGAIPKDGPSAGVAMCTAIVSAFTETKIKCDIAMTGEFTLRGRVLGIGGLKEKLLAAQRGGIKTVIMPSENKKDLEDVPENVKEKLEIIPVTHVDEVLKIALVKNA
ncbi:MAG: endopeptidase La [Alphaproteobacteria bacterium]